MNEGSAAKRILLVEDSPGLRELTQNILSHSGFVVLAAENGPQAIALTQSAGPFDLLITDFTLPGMTGIELADCLREGGPIKVLFVSGHALDEVLSVQGLAERGADFLQKPYRAAALLERVKCVLDGSGSRDGATGGCDLLRA